MMNIEKKEPISAAQTLFLRNRELLEVAGVTDVIRFDEEEVQLATTGGSLTVEGSALHIQILDLDKGIVTIDGRVDALLYYDDESTGKTEKSGFFGKLFR